MATVKDIAKLAGVSPTTVSWALNGKPVSQESLQRVLQAADELNYHRKLSARSLRAGKVFSIGFYAINASLDSRLNGYLFPMLAGISKVLSDEEYSMQFDIVTPSTTKLLAKKALEHAVDGMLILPQFTDMTTHLLKEIPSQTPVVFMQLDTGVRQSYCVSVDHAKGSEIAIRYLYSMGHRDIAVITGPANHIDSIGRVQAYRSVMAELGLPIKPHWFVEGQFGLSDGYRGLNDIIASGALPTAVFCLNDYMAVGAMRAAMEHRLRVPEDISIIGFDDTDITEACFPRLTTVRQPVFHQGQQAAHMLLNLIKGHPITHPVLTIEPTMVLRESVFRR